MKFTKLLASAVLLSSASAFAATQMFEVDLGTNKKFNSWDAATIYALGFKINDRYSISAETINTVTLLKDGNDNFGVTHGTLRGILTDKSLWTLSGEKVTTNYRYVLPTSQTWQAQGSYGRFGFRNSVTPKWGDFALFARFEALLYLQRNGYQTNPVGNANPTGNPIVGDILEISPGYEIGKGLSVSYYFMLQTILFGKDKGGTSTSVKHLQNSEVELGWESPVKGLNFALNISMNDERAVKFGDLRWFKADDLGLTLKTIYSF